MSFRWRGRSCLTNYGGAPDRNWPAVREAMLNVLALSKTGMGTNIDIGEEKDIHPKNKQEVGRRLSLWAFGTVYGKNVPATSGPLPAGHEVRGREIVVRFKHADGGLVAKGGPLQGFVIAGEDRQWKPAEARIAGATVVVSRPDNFAARRGALRVGEFSDLQPLQQLRSSRIPVSDRRLEVSGHRPQGREATISSVSHRLTCATGVGVSETVSKSRGGVRGEVVVALTRILFELGVNAATFRGI